MIDDVANGDNLRLRSVRSCWVDRDRKVLQGVANDQKYAYIPVKKGKEVMTASKNLAGDGVGACH